MSAAHLRKLRGQIDPVLTNIAIGYKQAEFIGEQIFPVVMVDKEGIQVPKFGKGSFVEYETERAVGAASNIITLDKPKLLPVVLEEHDLAAGVDYREQAESLFDEQTKATRRVVSGIQLRQEIEIATLLQDKAAYESGHHKDLSAATKWSVDTADPVKDVADAKEVVRAACGVRPNVLVLGAAVAHKLAYHRALQAVLGSNERKLITPELMKIIFDVDEVIIGNAVAAPAPNKQTKDVWGNFAALIVRPKVQASGNDEGEPSFGYTFRRKGMPVVDRYEEHGGKVEFARYTDIRKVAAVGGACGFLFEKVI
ncbi:hypothetical protein QG085_04865 [Kingella kingae]|uniref:major capsid protein n=1 Tax=Kingella kingae TaxID=504 RepID=UPI002550CFE5|nr:hypothetical protein [Kingella kingae]MDK4544765.1 hypothetical protein [Kingella kingae]MDK4566848.1 hypothetical protein [Kingella kingae]MDK4589835.1 hypothetical protein [Kingella kingae]MDK4628529.1 hypothetical protein [Kingella kingae]MDK4636405.1 hypothetical protein [Kingella kingae]